jgi:hypothetical protein
MGANPCKALGIQPGVPIGTTNFNAIWGKYGSKKTVANGGYLTPKAARKVLIDIASASGIPFSEETANRIVKENTECVSASTSSSTLKRIPYEKFKNLFREMVVEEPRFQLTQSLQVQIGDKEEVQGDVLESLRKKAKIGEDGLTTPSPAFSSVCKLRKVPRPSSPVPLPLGWQRSYQPSNSVSTRIGTRTSPSEASSKRTFELIWGENTSLPIDVLEANFFFNLIPFLNSCLVEIEFVVTNQCCSSEEIQAKLRLPLTNGAVVSRFAFEAIEGTLIEALVLPKKKATAVEYLEKEKGRTVGTTKRVEGNLFETTVFPLPYQQTRRYPLVLHFISSHLNSHLTSPPTPPLILPLTSHLSSLISYFSPLSRMVVSYLTQLERSTTPEGKPSWFYTLPFSFKSPIKVFTAGFNIFPEDGKDIRHSSPLEQKDTDLSEGFLLEGDLDTTAATASLSASSASASASSPLCVVGENEGLLHFAAYISPQLIAEHLKSTDNSHPKLKKVSQVRFFPSFFCFFVFLLLLLFLFLSLLFWPSHPFLLFLSLMSSKTSCSIL